MEFDQLLEIIGGVMDIEPDKITEDMTFKDDLCADSLDLFTIIDEINEEFEIEIPTEELENITTVGDAYEIINRLFPED